jgi:hypothetical protein
MDTARNSQLPSGLQRHLTSLKLVSRLLGHELHAQSTQKVISLSRDAVQEIQTTLDLFIEECASRSNTAGGLGAGEPRLVGQRN